MKRLARAAVIAAPILALGATGASADQFVRMVSGPSGGSWYPLGAKIMQVMQDQIDGIAASNTSGGGIANVKAVSDGDAELGWTYAHTAANGFAGKGKFEKPAKDIAYFATLYPSTFQVAVPRDSKIMSFEDMKNANISPGKTGWTGTAFAESILQAYGFNFEDIKNNGGTVHYVDYTESVALMKDGHIDVFMAATSMPQASYIELNHSPGLRFIGIPEPKLTEIIKANPGYIRGAITPAAYDGVEKDIPTLGIVTSMIVNKDLPDDLVYQMMTVFWDNHAAFAEVKKTWNEVTLEDALNGASVPVHPGAARYYEEKGVRPAS
ncbi:TAXI family TRAP transporter solute-binding subunit [Thalassobaculum sp. OXR-137]|uniref:TAXI family TRAP transporter solute-binding subunit n=1 Tax=Thalassobaculum sp. OXR-137 TaxID=3100173 RepID=UPI002AC93DAD|nr:TAXI family TRAP transporter solute-binding subunit [Thalassobaculum sp. OXR-137]WPZ35213.1 TAXI family TRAP transporter solute-binding subunit [Thalassobaculum sp. OXR-137]